MNEKLKHDLDLFCANTLEIKQRFKWQHSIMQRTASLLFVAQGRKADCGAIEDCLNMIKGRVGVFSQLRGNSVLCAASMLALSENPQKTLDAVLSAYDSMKRAGFRQSDYLILSAFQIALRSGAQDEIARISARAKEFFDAMKDRSRLLTGYDDYISCTLLALTDLNPQDAALRMERVRQSLRYEFASKNGVQALAQVLVLFCADSAPQRVVQLQEALKARKRSMKVSTLLPALGILSVLPGSVEQTADEVDEACAYLRSFKGFGRWSVPESELLLGVSALLATAQLGASQENRAQITASVIASVIGIVIAQQTAAVAAATAGAVAPG